MNDELQDYARSQLKKGLAECTDAQQLLFKRMYSHKNLELSINQVVNNISEEKLNRAIEQVQKTIDNN